MPRSKTPLRPLREALRIRMGEGAALPDDLWLPAGPQGSALLTDGFIRKCLSFGSFFTCSSSLVWYSEDRLEDWLVGA